MNNPYFPLTPGLVTRLHGTDGDEQFVEKVRITHRTKMIAGVRAVVVRDVVRRPDGTLAEATDDWYADDDQGNVWYLGEDTATYDEHGAPRGPRGLVGGRGGRRRSRASSCRPYPRPSDRDAGMEFSKGVAEDQAWVVQRLGRVITPGGRFTDIVRTLEWSRLEPRVVSQKFYAAGLGIVEERDLAAGDEHFWVVSTTDERAARALTAQTSSRNRSITRTPNSSASVGTRSSTPWNSAVKSRSAGSRSGAKP